MTEADSEVVKVVTTFHVCYTRATKSFIKSGLRPDQWQYNGNGNPITRPWVKERLFHEAAALNFITEYTTIPVAKVIRYGVRDGGVPYLELERIPGTECHMVGKECRMPRKPGHEPKGRCSTCQQIATANAELFIWEVVLPQLKGLRSNTTGLNGFVMPPVWALNHDKKVVLGA
jgi:hypothetical protein